MQPPARMQSQAQMQAPAALEAAPSAQPWAQPQEPAQQQTGSWPVLGGDLPQPQGATYGGGMQSGFPTDTLVGLPLDAGAGLPAPTGTGLPAGAGLPADAGLPAGAGLPVDTGMYAGSATNGAGFTTSPLGGFSADSLIGQRSGSAMGLPAGVDTGYDTGYPTGTLGAGSVTATGQSAKAAKAVSFVQSQTGKPCVWGASGPGSYDGPGLVQAAWRAAGVMLPRATWDQVRSGTTLVSVADALPGDLIFYYDDISHVGIYIGDGKMIHAANPGSYVSEDSIYSMPIHSVVRPG